MIKHPKPEKGPKNVGATKMPPLLLFRYTIWHAQTFFVSLQKLHNTMEMGMREKISEHCSRPSTSENGKIWQKSGFSPFWLHWFLCGWACRGCVHNCYRACVCAVLSWLSACMCILSCLPLCQSVSVSLRRGQLSACWELMKMQRCQKALWERTW